MSGRARFALLGYGDTNNIGDEIQSLAAKRFIPTDHEVVDRELTSSYISSDDSARCIIMNGWYAHNPERWPPSRYLRPLFISMHISEDPGWHTGLVAKDFLLSARATRYLQSLQPIGARDLNTLRLLHSAGIEAYFSGCLTLTLQRRNVPRNDKLVVLNDLPKDVSDVMHERVDGTTEVTQHTNLYINSQSDRFAYAERLLEIYSSARCVVTSRLHCALPCLAMGTPVLFINTAFDGYRFNGLSELLHCASKADLPASLDHFDINNPPENPKKHLLLKDSLVETAERFVKDCQSDPTWHHPIQEEDYRSIKDEYFDLMSSALRRKTDLIRNIRIVGK